MSHPSSDDRERLPVEHVTTGSQSRRLSRISTASDDGGGGVNNEQGYDLSELYSRLSEVAAPEPVENRDEGAIYHRHSLEDAVAQTGDLGRATSRRRSASSRPALSDHGSVSFSALSEVRGPPPVENPTEAPLFRHHSIEEGRPPSQQRIARAATAEEGCIIAYLVFFSLLGTLARLGLNALTTYAGAPVTFGVLWSNVAGTAVLGFLAEMAPLLHRHRQPDAASKQETSGVSGDDGDIGTDNREPPSWKRHPMPLYIGLATGFCGSFTSFSSFMLNVFEALSNTLPAPDYHTGDAAGLAPRGVGRDILALLAVVALTVGMCLAALQFGAHVALAATALASRCGLGVPPAAARRLQPWADRTAVVLAVGGWLAVVFVAIWPPDRAWRGDVLFALVFAPLGTLARFYVSLRLNGVLSAFPLGTFVVNIAGTAVLGMAWDLQRAPSASLRVSAAGCQVLQGVIDGFCGCLTTISTWMAELAGLRRAHAYVYGGTSVVSGVVVAVLIMGTMKWTVGWQEPVCL